MNDALVRPESPSAPPVALTIAGSDSGGGAGIQADLKTFAALGVYGCSALTALTAQNTRGVQSVHPVPPDFVSAQLRSVLSDFPVSAAKTGMLANADIIRALLETLGEFESMALVVDPVMLATSGDRLLEREAEALLIRELLPRATLITPNLPEAAALLEEGIARTRDDRWRQAERLLALGPGAVLLKGGHGTGPDAEDLLLGNGFSETFSRPRLDTPNTHGSGCTLAAAITARLARGLSLPGAVGEAKDYLQGALAAGARWELGAGAGPLNHFHHQAVFIQSSQTLSDQGAHP